MVVSHLPRLVFPRALAPLTRLAHFRAHGIGKPTRASTIGKAGGCSSNGLLPCENTAKAPQPKGDHHGWHRAHDAAAMTSLRPPRGSCICANFLTCTASPAISFVPR